ncbi:MAG: hypothetical protein QOI58_3372 [Thermoanaerobaculia bacterium]|jgi:hypothetical protein|nr:hypothetical protein [Thermoanaerobaculia bacterium]
MMRRLFCMAAFLVAANAFAQTEIFDADDFVDPRELAGRALFISRASIGAAAGYGDQYRPLHQTMGFLHISNTFYWHGLQATYKHTEIRGSDDWSARNQPQPASLPSTVMTESLSGRRPVPQMYFNRDHSLDAPAPAPKDSVQFAWYHAFGPSAPMLRYQVTGGRQAVEPVAGLKNAEDEDYFYRVEVQTMIRLGGKSIFGDVNVSTITQRGARTNAQGVPLKSQQSAYTYSAHLPLLRVGRAFVVPTMTVGHVTGGAAISVANPSVDLIWSRGADINFHVTYSPSVQNIGNGWKTRNQIAVFADRALYAKLFGTRR